MNGSIRPTTGVPSTSSRKSSHTQLKTFEKRIGDLEKKSQVFEKKTQEQAEMNREKLRLAEEVKKRKGVT